jgi:hypothetical protein
MTAGSGGSLEDPLRDAEYRGARLRCPADRPPSHPRRHAELERAGSRVAVLYEKGVELPSDLGGAPYIPLDARGAWKLDLGRELPAVGISVDLNGAL